MDEEYPKVRAEKVRMPRSQDGEDGIQETVGREEIRLNSAAAWSQSRALTMHLMEKVCHRDNLNRAYKRVKANRGAAGVDRMSVDELYGWLISNKEGLIRSLKNGTYLPKAVKGVEIPKPNGGIRQLGIPTVVDRLVQQSILQVLTPIFDPTFSEFSFGFRPQRSAHQALHQASHYVSEGWRYVVDLDLEKFFDRVNHDILMSRLARWIGDRRLLKLIRRFLQVGMMKDGLVGPREEGTPQGGPLSPLLSNLLLDELDKELEERGHRFVRYADDCNMYMQSIVAGERVMKSITRFLEKKLRLRVNKEKSAVAHVSTRTFLGYRIHAGGHLRIATENLQRMKQRVRQLTSRSAGKSFQAIIGGLQQYLPGWVTYYRYASMVHLLQGLDAWIRRRLRCYRLKQQPLARPMARFLMRQGLPENRAWALASVNRGWWALSALPPSCEAMPNAFFEDLGLPNLLNRWRTLHASRKPPDATTLVRWCGGTVPAP